MKFNQYAKRIEIVNDKGMIEFVYPKVAEMFYVELRNCSSCDITEILQSDKKVTFDFGACTSPNSVRRTVFEKLMLECELLTG